jgi:hypothetical protein
MKYKFSVSTNYVGCEYEEEVEIDDSELVGLDEAGVDNVLMAYLTDWVWQNIDAHWEKLP